MLDPTKLIIIAVVAFLFFGPDKLPQIARTVGRFMREFKKVQEEMETTIRSEMYKADLGPNPDVNLNPGVGINAPVVTAESAAASATGSTGAAGWEHEDPDEEDEE